MAPAITDVARELERIQIANGGLLRAADVVREAAAPASPLHSHFQWDDGEAAHQWRLCQARNLIRVTVAYLPHDNTAHVTRVFVSLLEDRTQPGGGYRVLTDVLASPGDRAQLLAEALREMHHFQARFRELSELAAVFAAMQRAQRMHPQNGDDPPNGTPPPPPPPPMLGGPLDNPGLL